ncbi:hypothetical protein VST7929_01018 [Vibrio stylophorae]|uniref:Penicillin-binding protein activator LpoB n=1 Tax=Vibrio stylophorae TaxID=659351 RepID=A0ABN8DUX6_9VIBR|nr:penicillin-binding protein activator LpoB [Vibrio stylophorae]CAH0533157.1 hypothetical protein VST7929_01018 [Vibrio stylophorae]
MKKTALAALFASALLSGCQSMMSPSTAYIDASDTQQHVAASLSYADFHKAATEMADELIATPGLAKANGARAIVYVGDVTNDTMQQFDTDQLTKTLRVKMLQSGKFAMTTAYGEDGATRDFRTLDKSPTTNKRTRLKKDGVVIPDYSLIGKIIQRDTMLDNGQTRIEYYFQLTLTNLEYGVAFWEGERVIGKVTSGETVSW